MICLSRSGSKTLAASEKDPSEVRGQPRFFCTFANSLACHGCLPAKEAVG